MKNKKLLPLLDTPLGLVIVLGSLISLVELWIMVIVQDALVPAIVPESAWAFIDAALLTLIVAPTLYFLVFRKMQKDITARKKMEADLRIAAIAFESQEGMTITDANRVILNVNQAFTRITGYSAEEAIGQTPALLKSGRQDDAFYQAMWKSLNRDKYWQGEIWNKRKNGEI
ncbi:MAG: hypothetical protein A2Z01_09440 [Betaproteobacteria bacterium RBG_16_58_11]|nr:MAG: hypothetical protein A2Z01_09440 [Betaproteobacteria bacterium RBG_16_58_11]